MTKVLSQLATASLLALSCFLVAGCGDAVDSASEAVGGAVDGVVEAGKEGMEKAKEAGGDMMDKATSGSDKH